MSIKIFRQETTFQRFLLTLKYLKHLQKGFEVHKFHRWFENMKKILSFNAYFTILIFFQYFNVNIHPSFTYINVWPKALRQACINYQSQYFSWIISKRNKVYQNLLGRSSWSQDSWIFQTLFVAYKHWLVLLPSNFFIICLKFSKVFLKSAHRKLHSYIWWPYLQFDQKCASKEKYFVPIHFSSNYLMC